MNSLNAAVVPTSAIMSQVVQGALELTEDDLVKGHRELPSPFKMFWWMQIGAAPVLLMFYNWTDFDLASLLPVAIFVLFFAWFLRILGPKSRGRKHFAALSPQERQVEYEFNPSSYRAATLVSEGRHQYGGLHRFIDGPSTFILYVSPQIAHLIPKRAFDAQGVDQISEWLRAGVEPKAKPSRGTTRAIILWVVLVAGLLMVWNLLGNPTQ